MKPLKIRSRKSTAPYRPRRKYLAGHAQVTRPGYIVSSQYKKHNGISTVVEKRQPTLPGQREKERKERKEAMSAEERIAASSSTILKLGIPDYNIVVKIPPEAYDAQGRFYYSVQPDLFPDLYLRILEAREADFRRTMAILVLLPNKRVHTGKDKGATRLQPLVRFPPERLPILDLSFTNPKPYGASSIKDDDDTGEGEEGEQETKERRKKETVAAAEQTEFLPELSLEVIKTVFPPKRSVGYLIVRLSDDIIEEDTTAGEEAIGNTNTRSTRMSATSTSSSFDDEEDWDDL